MVWHSLDIHTVQLLQTVHFFNVLPSLSFLLGDRETVKNLLVGQQTEVNVKWEHRKLPTFQKKHFMKWCIATSYMWTCVFNRIVIICIKVYLSKLICRRIPLIRRSWWFGTWGKQSQDLGFCRPLFPMHLLILWLYVGFPWAFWAHLAVIMALKGPEMSKQGTVGKRKHVTIMIPLNHEIIMRFESGKRWIKVMASSIVGLSSVLWCIEMGRSMTVVYDISWKCKGPFQ